MTTPLVPTRDSYAGVVGSDVAVNEALHAFVFLAFTADDDEVLTPELTSSRDGGIEVNGPGQTFVVPCEIQEFCIPRGSRC